MGRQVCCLDTDSQVVRLNERKAVGTRLSLTQIHSLSQKLVQKDTQKSASSLHCHEQKQGSSKQVLRHERGLTAVVREGKLEGTETDDRVERGVVFRERREVAVAVVGVNGDGGSRRGTSRRDSPLCKSAGANEEQIISILCLGARFV